MFLRLIDLLVATFNETCAPTSRKYVAEQRIVISNWSKKCSTSWSHSTFFALEKVPKNLNLQSLFTSNRLFLGNFIWKARTNFQKICSWARYSDPKLIRNNSNLSAALLDFCFRKTTQKSNFSQSFLSLIDPLVATLNERGALTFRKHVAGQGAMLPNWSKIIETFRSHSGVFALEKQLKILIFRSLFISNRPFAGYFQWNACTDFQKICSWTRYSDARLIENNWNF